MKTTTLCLYGFTDEDRKLLEQHSINMFGRANISKLVRYLARHSFFEEWENEYGEFNVLRIESPVKLRSEKG